MNIWSKSHHSLYCFAVVLSAAGGALIGCWSTDSGAQSTLGVVVDPPEISIDREQGDESEHPREVKFRLRNQTRKNVRIGAMQSSCSCTVAKPPNKKNLEPGDEVEVGMSVSVPASGEQTATITIETDCEQTPTIVLLVTARGTPMKPPYISIQPKEIRVLVQGDTTAVAEIFVDTVESTTDFQWLSDFSASDSQISIESLGNEVLYALPDGIIVKRYSIRATASNLVANGKGVTARLNFKFAKPASRESAPTWLFFQRTATVSVVPATVIIDRDCCDSETCIQELALIANDEEKWSCQPIDVPPFMSVTADLSDANLPSFAKRFRISVVRLSKVPSSKSTLRFLTSLPSAKFVEVPVEFDDAIITHQVEVSSAASDDETRSPSP
jgi:hypothetical protein